MANTLLHKKSSTADAVPTTGQLSLGEISVNTYDGKLFFKKNVSSVESIVTIQPEPFPTRKFSWSFSSGSGTINRRLLRFNNDSSVAGTDVKFSYIFKSNMATVKEVIEASGSVVRNANGNILISKQTVNSQFTASSPDFYFQSSTTGNYIDFFVTVDTTSYSSTIDFVVSGVYTVTTDSTNWTGGLGTLILSVGSDLSVSGYKITGYDTNSSQIPGLQLLKSGTSDSNVTLLGGSSSLVEQGYLSLYQLNQYSSQVVLSGGSSKDITGSTGGSVRVKGGTLFPNGFNNGKAGDVELLGGASQEPTIAGGSISILAGYGESYDSDSTGGSVEILAGPTDYGVSGSVTISGGRNYYGSINCGDVTISGGYCDEDSESNNGGGAVIIEGGKCKTTLTTTTNTNGDVILRTWLNGQWSGGSYTSTGYHAVIICDSQTALQLPVGAESLKSRINVANGMARYNSTSSRFEVREGGSWSTFALAGAALTTGGSAGQVLQKSSGTNYDAAWVSQPYDVGSSYNGKPAVSVVILRLPFNRTVVFPSSLTGSQGVAGTAATAQTDFDIKKNGSSVGTMRFAASGTTASFIMASQTTFNAGDVLTVVAPGTQDATLADIGFMLLGTR